MDGVCRIPNQREAMLHIMPRHLQLQRIGPDRSDRRNAPEVVAETHMQLFKKIALI